MLLLKPVPSYRCGFDNSVAAAPYGPAWRERRRMLHQVISASGTMAYYQDLMTSAKVAVQDILGDPTNFSTKIRT